MRRIAPTLVAALCALGAAAAPTLAGRTWETRSMVEPSELATITHVAITDSGEQVAVYDSNGGHMKAHVVSGDDSSTMQLDPDTGNQPLVASGGGSTVAVWRDLSSPGDTIRYAVRPDGGSFGPAQDAVPGYPIALRMDGHGDAALLSVVYKPEGSQLFLAVRDAGQPSFSAPAAISDLFTTSGILGSSELQMGFDGAIVAAWTQRVASGAYAVLAARARVDGGAPTVVTLTPDGAVNTTPAIGVDAPGDALVSWLDADPSDSHVGLVRASMTAGSGSFSPPMALDGRAAVSAPPRVGISGDGAGLLAWSPGAADGRAEPGEVVPFSISQGRFSDPLTLPSDGTGDQIWPVMDGGENAVVFFQELRTGEWRAVRKPAGAVAFDGPESIDCNSHYGSGAIESVYGAGTFGLVTETWVNNDHTVSLSFDHDTPGQTAGLCAGDHPPGWQPPPLTPSTPYDNYPDLPTALQRMNGQWDNRTIEGLTDFGQAGSSLLAREPGRLSVQWTLVGTKTVVATATAYFGAPGASPIIARLTKAGRSALRRAIFGTQVTSHATFTTASGTTTDDASIQLSHDWCRDVPPDVNCHPRWFGHTPGGRGVGKVSHSGWPSITGVLWVADDAGATGTATPVNDELLGGHGNDTFYGGRGDDVLWGDEWPTGNTVRQHDQLFGGAGDDWIYASHGINDIAGGSGNDTIWSVYARRAYIDAGTGDDRIVARRGSGIIDCGPGHDTVWVPKHGYQLSNCEDVRHTRPSPFARLRA